MSQHVYRTIDKQGQPVEVMMGYDRPLDYVYCTVFSLHSEEEEILYSNLADPEAGTSLQEVNYFRPVLQKLGITVPEAMFRETEKDQRRLAGNRVVHHQERGFRVS